MISRFHVFIFALSVSAVLPAQEASAQLVLRAIGGTAAEDVYGVGVGGGVGFELPLGPRGLYVGARGVYHTGQKLALGGGLSTESGLYMLGVEFGSAVINRPIIVRYTSLVGVASTSVKNLTSGSIVSKLTRNRFLFGPGILVALPIGPAQLGVEPRYLRVFGGKSSFAVYGSIALTIDLTP